VHWDTAWRSQRFREVTRRRWVRPQPWGVAATSSRACPAALRASWVARMSCGLLATLQAGRAKGLSLPEGGGEA
jgi:hypothetical protein